MVILGKTMRNKPITVKFTPKEKESIMNRCRLLDLNVSDYIRIKVFDPEKISFQEFLLKAKKAIFKEESK